MPTALWKFTTYAGLLIETFFQSVKQRGFRLEDTHLDDLERLRKLFALVAIAFTVCLHIGRWNDQYQINH